MLAWQWKGQPHGEGRDQGDLQRPLTPRGSSVTKSELRVSVGARRNTGPAHFTHPQSFTFTLQTWTPNPIFKYVTVKILFSFEDKNFGFSFAPTPRARSLKCACKMTISSRCDNALVCLCQALPQISWRCRRRPGCSCSSPPVRTCCGHTLRCRCQTPWSRPDVTGSHPPPFGSPPYADRIIGDDTHSL